MCSVRNFLFNENIFQSLFLRIYLYWISAEKQTNTNDENKKNLNIYNYIIIKKNIRYIHIIFRMFALFSWLLYYIVLFSSHVKMWIVLVVSKGHVPIQGWFQFNRIRCWFFMVLPCFPWDQIPSKIINKTSLTFPVKCS